MMLIFLIDFLYMILAGVVVMSNADILQEATLFQKGIAILIMMLFAPVLALANVINDILSIILGIEDNDKHGGFYE